MTPICEASRAAETKSSASAIWDLDLPMIGSQPLADNAESHGLISLGCLGTYLHCLSASLVHSGVDERLRHEKSKLSDWEG